MCAQETIRQDGDDRETSDAKDPAGRCRQVERLDDFDDLYQAGLSDDQLCGRMAAFADHFDIESDCSEIERRVIEDLKAYLRPSKAPDSLVRRCHRCLSECERTDRATGDTTSAVKGGQTSETAAVGDASGASAGQGAQDDGTAVEIPIR